MWLLGTVASIIRRTATPIKRVARVESCVVVVVVCMVCGGVYGMWFLGTVASIIRRTATPIERVARVESCVVVVVCFVDLFATVVLKTAPPVVRSMWRVVCRDGRSFVVLGDPLGDLLGHSWRPLEPSWGPPGALLGPSWGLLGASLGPPWALLEANGQKRGWT